ncbi:MAG TPA: hypothetical protein VGC50_08475, partial [Gammaproteobacteria bacterium]
MSVPADQGLNVTNAAPPQLEWPQTKIHGVATENSTLYGLTVALPIIAALTFAGCLAAWRQPLDGPHLLLGLLTILAASKVCSPKQTAAVLRADRPSWMGRTLLRILGLWSIAAGIGWIGIQLSGTSVNNDVLLSAAIAVPFVLWCSELALVHFLVRRSTSKTSDRAVIVGITDIGARWEARLAEDPSLGTQVVAYFDDRHESRTSVGTTAKRAGSLSDLQSFVRDQGIRAVYITLPMSRHARIMDLLGQLRDSTASVYFVPDIYAFDPIQGGIECVGGIALLAVWESPFRGAAALVKRACDIGVS